MTNVHNFLNFKDKCPLCNHDLVFHFLSNNNKRIKFQDNQLRVELLINGFNSPKERQKFTSYLYIDVESNHFYVDFLDSESGSLKFITQLKITHFKSFINSKAIQIYKKCSNCNNYHYASSHIYFDFKNNKLSPIMLKFENVKLTKKSKNDIRRYELTNNYFTQRSTILFDNAGLGTSITIKPDNLIEVPIIELSSKDELIKRLNTLITFA